MNIQMIGIDHNLASISCREMFSFTKKAGRDAMEEICLEENILGCVILSTCNRMEIWVHAEEGYQPSLYPLLCKIKNVDPQKYRDVFVSREGEEALRHLFRTTSGLNSLILGEDQILTQVKDSLVQARDVYCTDPELETLFRMAITAAKKVKSGMQKSMTNSSAVDQAVCRLKEMGMDFRGKTCMVIGNGEMGKRAAQAFKAEGSDVTVTVRQYRSGVVEIPLGCHRINYGDRLSFLPQCQIVVSATSSPNMTLNAADVSFFAMDIPQVYIDLAVPRDMDPEIGKLPGKKLFDIDEFSVVQSRENEEIIRRSEELLEEQLQEYIKWYEGRDLIEQVNEIGQKSAEDVYWRMGRTVKNLGLKDEESQVLEDAVCSASRKVVEKMLYTIRNEAGIQVFRSCLEALGSREKLS
ncbi:MAG: glutamyl-tRNA reductase [Clostridiales bacterium]|nr:glutamyl-tRNA reductase [Clostridiales bacterium]